MVCLLSTYSIVWTIWQVISYWVYTLNVYEKTPFVSGFKIDLFHDEQNWNNILMISRLKRSAINVFKWLQSKVKSEIHISNYFMSTFHNLVSQDVMGAVQNVHSPTYQITVWKFALPYSSVLNCQNSSST